MQFVCLVKLLWFECIHIAMLIKFQIPSNFMQQAKHVPTWIYVTWDRMV